jgi:phosphatidate cytidylyltransferase
MLKQRILTAIILIPLVIFGILYLPSYAVGLILGAVMLQGAWEWSRMAGLTISWQRFIYVLVLLMLMIYFWSGIDSPVLTKLLAPIALIGWSLAALWVFFPGVFSKKSFSGILVKLLAGAFVIVLSWYAMISMHMQLQHGPLWFLYFMGLIWVADSGAYFSGKAFGLHKLAPAVSPGKTWEGVAGALVLVCLYAVLSIWWLPVDMNQLVPLLAVSLFLVPVSVLGDLFESLMKRQSGLKDSGTLLPGHGGIMDRIDSMTAVFPITMWITTQVDFL